jgi:hypothetical protein
MLLLAAAVGWAYLRGTLPRRLLQDPIKAGRPVSQVYEWEGKTCVLASILLDYPREKVWAVVTDYSRYDQFLPFLDDVAVRPSADGCHMTGKAQAVIAGYWPFAIDIHESKAGRDIGWRPGVDANELLRNWDLRMALQAAVIYSGQLSDPRWWDDGPIRNNPLAFWDWTVSWDQVPNEKILVNRGTWTLIDRNRANNLGANGKNQTVLALTLEAEIRGYPTFLLRNVLLHRLPKVLRDVEARLQKEEQK